MFYNVLICLLATAIEPQWLKPASAVGFCVSLASLPFIWLMGRK